MYTCMGQLITSMLQRNEFFFVHVLTIFHLNIFTFQWYQGSEINKLPICSPQHTVNIQSLQMTVHGLNFSISTDHVGCKTIISCTMLKESPTIHRHTLDSSCIAIRHCIIQRHNWHRLWGELLYNNHMESLLSAAISAL